MSALSVVFWIPAAWLMPFRALRNGSWQSTAPAWTILAILATLGFAVSIFKDYLPLLDEHDGLVQRISFATYFSWYLYAAYRLVLTSSGPRLAQLA